MSGVPVHLVIAAIQDGKGADQALKDLKLSKTKA